MTPPSWSNTSFSDIFTELRQVPKNPEDFQFKKITQCAYAPRVLRDEKRPPLEEEEKYIEYKRFYLRKRRVSVLVTFQRQSTDNEGRETFTCMMPGTYYDVKTKKNQKRDPKSKITETTDIIFDSEKTTLSTAYKAESAKKLFINREQITTDTPNSKPLLPTDKLSQEEPVFRTRISRQQSLADPPPLTPRRPKQQQEEEKKEEEPRIAIITADPPRFVKIPLECVDAEIEKYHKAYQSFLNDNSESNTFLQWCIKNSVTTDYEKDPIPIYILTNILLFRAPKPPDLKSHLLDQKRLRMYTFDLEKETQEEKRKEAQEQALEFESEQSQRRNSLEAVLGKLPIDILNQICELVSTNRNWEIENLQNIHYSVYEILNEAKKSFSRNYEPINLFLEE